MAAKLVASSKLGHTVAGNANLGVQITTVGQNKLAKNGVGRQNGGTAWSVQQAAEQDLLGHIDCPDTRPTSQVKDTGFPIRRNGSLMQLVSSCYEEQLVIDVHAVFFRLCKASSVNDSASLELGWGKRAGRGRAHLIAGIHVNSPPKAMVVATMF